MSRSWKISLFVLSLFMMGMFFYLAVSPTYVLQISVQPRFSSRTITMSTDKEIGAYEGSAPIFYDIAGSLTDPNIRKVVLRVYPPDQAEEIYKNEADVSNGIFFRRVPLGSAKTLATGDTSYTYILDSAADQSHLSEGSIQVQVKAFVYGTSQVFLIIISALGLLASLLQIVQFAIWLKTPKES